MKLETVVKTTVLSAIVLGAIYVGVSLSKEKESNNRMKKEYGSNQRDNEYLDGLRVGGM
jgi:hypothetical protein